MSAPRNTAGMSVRRTEAISRLLKMLGGHNERTQSSRHPQPGLRISNQRAPMTAHGTGRAPRRERATANMSGDHQGIFNVTILERPGQSAGIGRQAFLLPVGDAARLVGALRERVDRAIKRGQLPYTRVDGRRLVSVVELREWMRRPQTGGTR